MRKNQNLRSFGIGGSPTAAMACLAPTTAISRLLRMRRPTAFALAIDLAFKLAVQRFADWSFAHIGEESFEAVLAAPSFANSHTDCSVSVIVVICWSFTPSVHCVKTVIGSGLIAAVVILASCPVLEVWVVQIPVVQVSVRAAGNRMIVYARFANPRRVLSSDSRNRSGKANALDLSSNRFWQPRQAPTTGRNADLQYLKLPLWNTHFLFLRIC